MTARNTDTMCSGKSGSRGPGKPDDTGSPWRTRGVHGMIHVLAGVAMAGVLATGCSREEGSVDSGPGMTATIEVVSAHGRLAGGEEYEIAEWRSGILPENGAGFADFRGQDGGPTLDLRLQGPDQVGEFACGEAGDASLELRVDGANTYRASTEAPCRVVVERRADGVIEGRYMATLRHTGNPSDEMEVRGAFRATNLSTAPAPEAPVNRATSRPANIQAAQGPALGLR